MQDLIGTAIIVASCSWMAFVVGYDRAQRRFDKPDPIATFLRERAMKINATRRFIPNECVVTLDCWYEVDGERYQMLIRKGGQ